MKTTRSVTFQSSNAKAFGRVSSGTSEGLGGNQMLAQVKVRRVDI